MKRNKKTFFFISDFLLKTRSSTRHIKYNVIDFAPSNKPIMANKLPSTNLQQFLKRI